MSFIKSVLTTAITAIVAVTVVREVQTFRRERMVAKMVDGALKDFNASIQNLDMRAGLKTVRDNAVADVVKARTQTTNVVSLFDKDESNLGEFDLFTKYYTQAEVAKRVIGYKESWANGTGYYNAMTTDASIIARENGLYACFDNTTQRRILVRVYDTYAVVAFDRFTGADRGVIVHNYPHVVCKEFAGLERIEVLKKLVA